MLRGYAAHLIESVFGFFEYLRGKPERRSRQSIQCGFGFRAIRISSSQVEM